MKFQPQNYIINKNGMSYQNYAKITIHRRKQNKNQLQLSCYLTSDIYEVLKRGINGRVVLDIYSTTLLLQVSFKIAEGQ